MASATNAGDVWDAQDAHGAEKPVRRSGINFFRQSTRDGRTMEHEKAPRMHRLWLSRTARKEGEARPQACREALNNSFGHEANTVPQPLGPEDLYATFVYVIKAASDTALREHDM